MIFAYTCKRLVLMLVTLWVIVTITFFLIHNLPGTPLKNEEKLPPEIREQILHEYGLDQPLYVQYGKFLWQLLHGDLGKSLIYDGRNITDMLQERFYASAFIGIQAILLGLVIGLLLGVCAALYPRTWVDHLTTSIAVLGVSIPNLVLAGLLSYFVGVQLGWLPPALWGSYAHTILPSLSLSVLVIAQIARYLRTELLEVFEQDYIKTARAKGLSWSRVVISHGLRNALIPSVTVLGPLTVNILTGSLVVEKVFGVPGMGALFVESILNNDYTAILGTTIFYSVLILATIFLVDLLYGLLDPRMRMAVGKEKRNGTTIVSANFD